MWQIVKRGDSKNKFAKRLTIKANKRKVKFRSEESDEKQIFCINSGNYSCIFYEFNFSISRKHRTGLSKFK